MGGHVEPGLRRRRGAVDEHQGAGVVGHRGDLGDRVLGAEDVGDVGDGDELGTTLEERREGIHVEPPLGVDRRPVDGGPGALGELLPGNDVRVVLHLGQDDAVAGTDVGVAPRPGDEVDRLGGVADEDHLAAVSGADVAGDCRPGALVRRGRLGRERVRAAVDVGVVAALVVVDRLDRVEDPLGAGAAVEVGDRLAVDLAVERRELGADLGEREAGVRDGAVGPGADRALGRRLLHGRGGARRRRPPRPPRGSSRSLCPRARRPARDRLA